MEVVSRCALPAAGFVWQPRAGAWAFTVVCKATFALLPDECPLAGAQQPLACDDSPPCDGPRRTLHRASDVVPFKKLPEVLVVGHAYAPRGTAASHLRVRVAVGAMDKAADVYGDRWFGVDGTLSEPTLFAKMPLSWERAAGAADGPNPAGVPTGEGARPDGSGRVPVPNIVPAGSVLRSRRDVIPQVGFGPISPSWPGRARKRSAGQSAWDGARWREAPLPADLDSGYFNAAPDDQHLPQIADGERIVLEGLHPDHPVLVTRLAVLRRVALASLKGEATHPVPLVADTLVIDTDAHLLTVTYRGRLRLDRPDREGWVVVTLKEPAAPAVKEWPPANHHAARAHTAESDPEIDVEQTLAKPVRLVDGEFLLWGKGPPSEDGASAGGGVPAGGGAPVGGEATAAATPRAHQEEAEEMRSRCEEIARFARELAALAEKGDLEGARALSAEIERLLREGEAGSP